MVLNLVSSTQPRLSFSPAASVWGQMRRAWTTGGRGALRTTEAITDTDYVAFFHQSFGLTNNPALALRSFCVLRTCHAHVTGISWVVKVPGTTSTPASTMPLIGPAYATMYCGRWSAFVTTLVSPPLTSACSRVRATAAPISKSATSAWRVNHRGIGALQQPRRPASRRARRARKPPPSPRSQGL